MNKSCCIEIQVQYAIYISLWLNYIFVNHTLLEIGGLGFDWLFRVKSRVKNYREFLLLGSVGLNGKKNQPPTAKKTPTNF